jgi:hypothetical protein
MNKSVFSTLTFVIFLSGCAQVQLPMNVTTIESGGTYIDRVDYSYQTDSTIDFSNLKLCVAENLTNNDVTLSDSSNSFVGAYTGNYYSTGKIQNIAGKDVFKYLDESSSTLIANGTTTSISNQLIPITDIVKFEMKSSLKGRNVQIEFFNITRAQKDTGLAANDGFSPVGAWSGARAPDIIASLERMANRIKSCLK